MPTPDNAPYKKAQRRKPLMASLWHGLGRSRAHPNRRYVRGEGGTIWRKENYDRRFGKRRR